MAGEAAKRYAPSFRAPRQRARCGRVAARQLAGKRVSRMCSPGIKPLVAIALATLLPAFATAQIPMQQFQSCGSIEDMTKERLDCFDALVPPEPRAVNLPAKTITECRFIREEDERLTCFNRFVLNPPATGRSIVTQRRPVRKPTAVTTTVLPTPPVRHETSAHVSRVRHSRGCGSRGGPGYRLPSGRCASRRH
jgi:hypothetical protein